MELVISIFWFIILYFGVFLSAKKQNIFAPIRFVCLLFILRNVTYLIILFFDPSVLSDDILRAIGVNLSDAVVQYTYVQTIAFIFLIIGISLVKNKKASKKSFNSNYTVISKASNIIFILGLLSYLSFLLSIGGLNFLLNNLSNRVEIQSGNYVKILMPLMSIAVVMKIKLYSISSSKKNLYTFFAFFIVAILANSSLGGRKTTVFLIIMCLLSYHFYIKKITLKSIKLTRFLIIVFFLGIYTFVIPILRSPNGFEKLVTGEVSVFDKVDLKVLVLYFSYTEIDIFCANYYNDNNKWCFSSLLTIPKNLDLSTPNDDRPPIDEGVYFYNIVKYNDEFTPPTNRKKMKVISLPIENFGFGYANYLVPGVIISFLLLGIVYKRVYNVFIYRYDNPLFIYFYLDILFNFNFSSLRIINLLFLLINLTMASLIYKYILLKQKN